RDLHAPGRLHRRRLGPPHAARGAGQRAPRQSGRRVEDPRPPGALVSRPQRLAALVLAALLGAAAAARADTFVGGLGRRRITQPLAEALADTIGRSFPVVAASPGLTFTFDPETHTFERSTDVLGQVLLERARPLGRGKWNLSLVYQWVRIDTVDGH